MLEPWYKRFVFGPREIIEGVPYYVMRDNIEGRAYYHHGRDPRKNGFCALFRDQLNGVYPYIETHGDGRVNLWVYLASARCYYNSSVLLNMDGKLVKRDCGDGKTQTVDACGDRVTCQVFDFICDDTWVDGLQHLTRATLAVMRFKGTHRDSYYDQEITKKNMRLVAEVLTAYSSLKAARQASPHPGPEPITTDQRPNSNAVEKGPFCLWSDGTITDRDSRLRLPPGVQVGEIHLDRFALKSDPTGHYVITDPEGRATSHRFRGGRWEQATPDKKS